MVCFLTRRTFLLAVMLGGFPSASRDILHCQAAGKDDSQNRCALSEVVILPRGAHDGIHQLERRQGTPTPLKNNSPVLKDINPGDIHYWLFPSSELEGPLSRAPAVLPPWQPQSSSVAIRENSHQELRRQSQSHIYITVNVCLQPSAMGQLPTGPPPLLSLYMSHSPANNKNPGPLYTGSEQTDPIQATGGRAFHDELQTGDTYIGVSAPQAPGFSGRWTYQISVSNQAYYTAFYDWPSLNTVDSDSNSSFFVTNSLVYPGSNNTQLAQQWNATGGPFGIFIYDSKDPMMAGINRSFCGLSNYALAKGQLKDISSPGSEAGMRLFNNTLPYQQFYVTGLNHSTSYKAALALPGNYSLSLNSQTPAGGGSVWKSIDFVTRKNDTNCQLIYNLTFCDDVAYAVPTNSTFYGNRKMLAEQYDNYTLNPLWTNFRNSLDQIPCNTSSDARYSLARTCDDCAKAYKSWVCAVSIPRCAHISSNAPFLRWRNTQGSGNFVNGSDPSSFGNLDINDPANAQSRNRNLTNWVAGTGPYKEVLPCERLCYNLVQSCPSVLGFACPWLGHGLEWSYGNTSTGQNTSLNVDDGYPTCNLPGVIWAVNGSSRHKSPLMFTSLIIIIGFLLHLY